MENDDSYNYNDNFIRSSFFGFSSRRVSSPETISLEPNSSQSVKLSVDDLELNSPSSAVSSICHSTEAKFGPGRGDDVDEPKAQQVLDHQERVGEEVEDKDDDDDDEEVMSSYVIEINSDYREGTVCHAVGIDEAIAWAKEKFQKHSEEDLRQQQQHNDQQTVDTLPHHAGDFNYVLLT